MEFNKLNPIIETYSQLAAQYDADRNLKSCWGLAAEKALTSVALRDHYQVVVDVGCGSGRALARLAAQSKPNVELIGLEPAPNMRTLARTLTQQYPKIQIQDGSFEMMPIPSGTVDYLYSIFAFHWTPNLELSVRELHRVLKTTGDMDLFFIGRDNGQEFIRKTTPIFLKYMGPIRLLQSAALRKQLTRETAFQLFQRKFGDRFFSVEESYDTYYDTLEGHWGWWVRIEGHFVQIPAERREDCDREIMDAINSLNTKSGIPYTIHVLHVRVRSAPTF